MYALKILIKDNSNDKNSDLKVQKSWLQRNDVAFEHLPTVDGLVYSVLTSMFLHETMNFSLDSQMLQ